LAYTYGTNGNPVPRGKNYLTNVIDTALMRNDIARAKALKPDILLTYLHFGEEYKRKANEFQKQIATFLKNSGVDLIIASHPHVIEPMEFFKTNNDQFPNGLVAYSLGNFISDQRWRYTDAGMILTLTIEKHSASGILSLCTPEVTPTWVFKGIVNNKRSHRVLPSSDTSRFQFLTSSDKEKMIQSYNDTKELLLKNTTMIHITR
jgi:poly-gamma-glutamate synthesis protein (capsule biosynthesis protein)